MEHKLFYQDSYMKEFSTKGLRQQQDEEGRWYITLRETAFYPTGGGQPYDQGTLNGVHVINVEEIDGEIRHYVEEPVSDTEEIFGAIDWNRRFDHMQQHAGQHILTAAFVELFGVETVSFHLGEETSTIDLHTEQLTEEMAVAAEKRANEIILKNRPIEARWVTQEEALKYNLRKELTVTDNIRLIIIPDFDYNGCGGTHPDSTSQVGSVKILNWERQKKKIRVQFVCGQRVLEQLHRKQKVMLELSRLLSAPELEMGEAVTRLIEYGRELNKSVEELREKLLQKEGKDLLSSFMMMNGNRVVANVYQGRAIQELQKLAKMVAKEDEEMNVFFVNENGGQLQFVCTRGNAGKINMKSIAKQVLPLVNGRGGGNESTAQGGGEALISGKELLEKMLEKIS